MDADTFDEKLTLISLFMMKTYFTCKPREILAGGKSQGNVFLLARVEHDRLAIIDHAFPGGAASAQRLRPLLQYLAPSFRRRRALKPLHALIL